MSEPPWPPGSYAEAHAEERANKATENEPAAATPDIMDLPGEDLACLGLRRAFKDDFFSDQKKQAHEDYLASLPKPRKPSKPRKPTLVSVSKDARKAGIDPARIEIKPDGSYVVDIGKPEPVAPENPWPLDEFRTKETKQ